MNGYQGQLRAFDQQGRVFPANIELISLFADVPPETTFRYVKKLSIFTLQGVRMRINGKEIRIGETGIYEVEDVEITSFMFIEDAPTQTIIDFIIQT